ncbi:Alpha/Beta hydrolase protein [Phascolomyces articulosus]|uniref:Dipeptidyl-peptidase V n=1 Tax=Phascolomyces articulosus TaxID=60185 RepID=A0AAD5P889_9FUNG|nr:Alpha/Beta hydrolase protein [Phascolomyces articulosus]
MVLQNTWVLILGAFFLIMVVNARSLQPIDVISLPRPGSAAVSPNGNLAVYAQSKYHVEEDQSASNLELIELNSNGRSSLTTPKLGASQSEPFFLDDQHIAYFEHRESEAVNQLYVLDVEGKTDPYQLTNFSIDFANVKYNTKKRVLVFSAQVYPDAPTLDGTKAKEDELKKTKKDSGIAYDHLMVRHWDQFVVQKKHNIFAVHLDVSEDGRYKVSEEPLNLLAGSELESPDNAFPSNSDFDISPDGEEVAFVSKIQSPDNAWQTSKHVYIVPIAGHSRPFPLNGDIPAASGSPTYAPSGSLAYLQMLTPQYESDRNRIVVYDRATGHRSYLVEAWDRSPSELAFSPDSSVLYVVAEEYGREKIFSINIKSEEILPLTQEHAASGISVLPSGSLVFSVNSMQFPNVVHTLDISTGLVQATGVPTDLFETLKEIDLQKPEEFEFRGALGDQVHGWLIKPPNFDPDAKYPIAFLIHGGPQGAWTDSWSTRWNPQVFAGAGFVTVAINPHGSTGYGQDFCDSIQHNWGSHPYHDLEMGLDYLFETYSFLDSNRVAGLGASYGGYMINWINGHSKRFRVLVNHDGMFSAINSYYTTDEVYFPEREFGGVPYSPLHRILYERWSPSNFVQNWKTPTLVIHSKFTIYHTTNYLDM